MEHGKSRGACHSFLYPIYYVSFLFLPPLACCECVVYPIAWASAFGKFYLAHMHRFPTQADSGVLFKLLSQLADDKTLSTEPSLCGKWKEGTENLFRSLDNGFFGCANFFLRSLRLFTQLRFAHISSLLFEFIRLSSEREEIHCQGQWDTKEGSIKGFLIYKDAFCFSEVGRNP